MSQNKMTVADYKRRAMQLAIAEAIAHAYSYAMSLEAKNFPTVSQADAPTNSARRRPLAEAVLTVRGKRQAVKLSASATLTLRPDFIPPWLALRNAIARGGSDSRKGFATLNPELSCWWHPTTGINDAMSFGYPGSAS